MKVRLECSQSSNGVFNSRDVKETFLEKSFLKFEPLDAEMSDCDWTAETLSGPNGREENPPP